MCTSCHIVYRKLLGYDILVWWLGTNSVEDHNSSTFTYSGIWVATQSHASSRAVLGGNNSEENCASIFKVVNVKVVYSSKMFVTTYQTTLCHIPVVNLSVFTAMKTSVLSHYCLCAQLCAGQYLQG